MGIEMRNMGQRCATGDAAGRRKKRRTNSSRQKQSHTDLYCAVMILQHPGEVMQLQMVSGGRPFVVRWSKVAAAKSLVVAAVVVVCRGEWRVE